ncbi:MAG: cytochrome c biogenesis CcdA family protein [Actinomycetota bacterium]
MAFAFMGGALAILNPCGFPLLVAHLSLSMGSEGQRGGAAREGLIRGLAVALGFVATLVALAVPLALGLHGAVRAVPRAGLVVGVALVGVGILMLTGRSTSISTRLRMRPVNGSFRSYVALGVAQGITALGCTLPVFLAVVGAASATDGMSGVLATVAAYAAGAAMFLVILSIGATSMGHALRSKLHSAMRHVRVAGALLLIVAGTYITYFWWRLSFAPGASLASDPLIGGVQSFSSWIYRSASGGGATPSALTLAALLLVVGASMLWRSRGDGVPAPTSRKKEE